MLLPDIKKAVEAGNISKIDEVLYSFFMEALAENNKSSDLHDVIIEQFESLIQDDKSRNIDGTGTIFSLITHILGRLGF